MDNIFDKLTAFFFGKKYLEEQDSHEPSVEVKQPVTEAQSRPRTSPLKEDFIKEVKSGTYDYLFEDENRLKMLLDMGRYFYDAKEAVMVSSPGPVYDLDNMVLYSLNNNPDLTFIRSAFLSLRNHIVRTLGEEQYNTELERWDYDLAMAYKEADYHILRANYFEVMNQYINTINDPNGMKAPEARQLYMEAQELKEKYENFS